MNLSDLPTNDLWSGYDWEYVLFGSSYYEGAFWAPGGARAEDITADRIARVAGWAVENPEGMADYNFAAIVELVDGTWAGCMAWTDTSGWGCQQGVYWRVTESVPDAITFALDNEGRRRHGAALPADTAEWAR